MMSNSEIIGAMTPRGLSEAAVSQWIIPIYQRLFVWEEEQIRQLLDDLDRAFDKAPEQPYYIGIFTVVDNQKQEVKSEASDAQKQPSEWTVVDGQQRLTFLSLFAAWCIRTGTNPEMWRGLLYRSETAFRICYFGRESDTKDLQAIVGNHTVDTLQNRNFRVFCSCMERKKREMEEGARSFVDFTRFVFEHTSFLISKLPAGYDETDLNRFFEKMNASGRQLSVIDQIRGRYFPAHGAEFDKCLDFERKYQESREGNQPGGTAKQVGMLDILSSAQVVPMKPEARAVNEANARSVLLPEIMLLHVLSLTIGEGKVPHDMHLILETFKQEFQNDVFLENLKAYRAWLDEHVIYLDSADGNAHEYKLRNIKNEVDEEGDSNAPETSERNARRKLIQFQSMLYVASDVWQGWVLEQYRALSGQKSLNAAAELQTLRENEKKKWLLPKRETLCYGSIDRYWFWTLDYILWEQVMNGNNLGLDKADLETIKAYRFRRNRSIEHLHPQNPQISQETADWLNDRNENKDFVRNSFGNLAMISTSFNSAQGNDSVGVKFARVKDTQIPNMTLESIKLLLMFRAAETSDKSKSPNQNWTTNLAKTHGEAMYCLLANYYAKQF